MILRDLIADRVTEAFQEAQRQGVLPPAPMSEAFVERPQNPQYGEFATSLPMKLARAVGMNPLEIAQRLAPLIPLGQELAQVEVAHPGFINFTLDQAWLREQVDTIVAAGPHYGDTDTGGGRRVQVEYVSVNPTGPLHVGAARWAVLGSTLAAVLQAAGYDVSREYYVNDAGSQMDAFYRSLYARYLQALGREAEVPPDGYQGAYMVDLAQELVQAKGDRFLSMSEEDALRELGQWGLQRMLQGIRDDLERIRVQFDVWFSEQSLYEGSDYNSVVEKFRGDGYLAQREGATWFISTALGDDKDNVLVRSTGAPTYFASDIAYHFNKFLVRGFDRVIDIWGADHQGHVPRMKAAVSALGIDPERFDIIIGQLVTLKRGAETVRASKRTGELVTLRELLNEVGPDACRYFFLTRSPEAQMEFDMDLATRQSQENPVYYIQYAHARIAGILRQAEEQGISSEDAQIQLLTSPEELDLIRSMLTLPELVDSMARAQEPHHLPHYALQLATAFHWFYDRCRVITDDPALTRARLKLVEAARVVLARCLAIMDMEAPERM